MRIRDLKKLGIGYNYVQTPSGDAKVFTAEAILFFHESLGIPVEILCDIINNHNDNNFNAKTDSYKDFWTADINGYKRLMKENQQRSRLNRK